MAGAIRGSRSRSGEKALPAEGRLNHQIHENHHIYRDISVIWKRRAPRFWLARQHEEILQELRQLPLPHSLSLAYSGGLQISGLVAAAQVEEDASISEIFPPRLVKGLHLMLSVQAARKDSALRARSLRKSHGRKAASGRAGTLQFERKPIMTCRIERVGSGEGVVILRMCGQIADQDVDLLRALLERETRAPVLDLKDILLVDRGAVQLLALSESNGTELRNCPPYIREWVTRERATGVRRSKREKKVEDPNDVRCEP
jgi:hypothetical protein